VKASKAYMIAFKLQAQLGKNFGKTFQEAENIATRLGDRMTSIGKGLTLRVTAPLMAIGAGALRIGADLESTLGDIQAHTSKTAEEIDQLSTSFRGLAVAGSYGAFTARNITDAFSNVAVEGMNVYDSTELMRKAMVFATGTNNSLASATGLLNLSLVKTQSDVSHAERYINAFAETIAQSQMSVSNLEKAIVTLAPTMNQSGDSMEFFNATLSQLYQGGLYGISAGRGLEQIFNALVSPSDAAAAAMHRLEFSMFDCFGNVRQLSDVMPELMRALDGVTTEYERLNLQSDLFSTVYSRAVFDELSRNRNAWTDNVYAMYEATSALDGTGRAFQMAAIQNSGLAASSRHLRASLEEVKLTISDALMPHAMWLVDGVRSLVQGFANLDEGTQRLIIRIAMFAAAAGPVLMIGGKIFKTVGKMHGVYTKFKATLTAVKTAQELSNAATAANTKLTKINTAVTATAKKASAARKLATTAENQALRLAAQAELLRAQHGATHTKAIAAATAAEKARTVATNAGKIANKHANTLDKIRTNQTIVNTAALKANAAVTNASALAGTKLGKVLAFVTKVNTAATMKKMAFGTTLAGVSVKMNLLSVSMAKATVAQKLMAFGTKGLSVAFKVMSAAIMKIPVFGWILAAITGVIAVVAALVRWLNRVGEEYAAMGEEAEKLLERQQALTDAAYNAAIRFEEQTQAMANSQMRTAYLAEQIEYLASRYSLTSAEMARMDSYIAELNNSTPGLTLAYDAQAGALNMTADALSAYLSMAQLEAQVIAQRQESARLWNEELELAQAYYETSQRRYEMEAKLNDGTRRSRANRRALEAAVNDLITAEEGYRYALEANAARYTEVNRLIYDNVNALEHKRRVQEQAEIAMHGYEMAMRRMAFTAEEWADAQNKALSRMNNAFETHMQVAGNAFDTVNQRATISFEEMIANMNANAAAVAMKSDNLAILVTKGLEEGLINQLRKMGPAAADQVALLVKELEAAPNRLYELNSAFASSADAAMGAMINELDPHGVAESAYDLIDHVALTILENPAMEVALIAKVNSSFEAFSNTIDYIGFDMGGYYMVVGAAKGIENGTIHIERALVNAANRGMTAFENALLISSPSMRAFGAGEKTIDGYVLAIYSKYDEVEKVCSGLADVVANSLQVNLPDITAPKVYPFGANPLSFGNGGYSNALGSQGGFSRFPNLGFGDDGSNPTSGARPIDSINRINNAGTYNTDSFVLNYNPSYSIDGSGHNTSELEAMVRSLTQEGYGDIVQIVNQIIDARKKKEGRLTNA